MNKLRTLNIFVVIHIGINYMLFIEKMYYINITLIFVHYSRLENKFNGAFRILFYQLL